MNMRAFVVIGLSWTWAAGNALAQEPATPPGGATTISGTGGLTAGMHGTGPVLGGSA